MFNFINCNVERGYVFSPLWTPWSEYHIYLLWLEFLNLFAHGYISNVELTHC